MVILIYTGAEIERKKNEQVGFFFVFSLSVEGSERAHFHVGIHKTY